MESSITFRQIEINLKLNRKELMDLLCICKSFICDDDEDSYPPDLIAQNLIDLIEANTGDK